MIFEVEGFKKKTAPVILLQIPSAKELPRSDDPEYLAGLAGIQQNYVGRLFARHYNPVSYCSLIVTELATVAAASTLGGSIGAAISIGFTLAHGAITSRKIHRTIISRRQDFIRENWEKIMVWRKCKFEIQQINHAYEMQDGKTYRAHRLNLKDAKELRPDLTCSMSDLRTNLREHAIRTGVQRSLLGRVIGKAFQLEKPVLAS